MGDFNVTEQEHFQRGEVPIRGEATEALVEETLEGEVMGAEEEIKAAGAIKIMVDIVINGGGDISIKVGATTTSGVERISTRELTAGEVFKEQTAGEVFKEAKSM